MQTSVDSCFRAKSGWNRDLWLFPSPSGSSLFALALVFNPVTAVGKQPPLPEILRAALPTGGAGGDHRRGEDTPAKVWKYLLYFCNVSGDVYILVEATGGRENPEKVGHHHHVWCPNPVKLLHFHHCMQHLCNSRQYYYCLCICTTVQTSGARLGKLFR